jgi:hypothetical protein
MSLPLTLKKNIRDAEPKRDASMDNVKEYFGFSEKPTMEVADDLWLTLWESRNGTPQQTSIGRWVYEDLPKGFLHGLTDLLKDAPECKAALAQAWTTKKLIISLTGFEAHGSNLHHNLVLNDGSLIIIGKSAKNMFDMTASIGRNPRVLDTINLTAGGLPWKMKWELEQPGVQKKITAALDSLRATTQFKEVTWEADLEKIGDGFETRKPSRPKYNAPTAVSHLLGGLAENIAKCFKDDMVKEAILDKWKSGKVLIRWDETVPAAQHNDDGFEDGHLLLRISGDGMTARAGSRLEQKL